MCPRLHIKSSKGPVQFGGPRHWRTRRDPFAEVFTSEVIPLLEADREGVQETKMILTGLVRRHPGQFGAGQLHTLQRRLHEWRALEEPDKEAYFRSIIRPAERRPLISPGATIWA